MNRVTIKNNLPAPQGFYATVASDLRPGGVEGVDPVGYEAVIVKPGETSAPIILNDEQLRLARLLGSGITITPVAAPAKAGEPSLGEPQPAPAPAADTMPAGAAKNDSITTDDALTPPRDNTRGGAPAEGEKPDPFEGMDDDALRAYLTDKGVAFHHRNGRETLLRLARGEGPAGGAADDGEGV